MPGLDIRFDTKIYSECPEHMYNMVKTKKKLNSAIERNASQQEVSELFENMTKVVEAFEAYKKEAEEEVKVCWLGGEGWSWVKFGASGIVFAASCVPLGASIETALAANYTVCPQSRTVLALNVAAAAVTLAAFAINGFVMLLDQWRSNRIELQFKDLKNAKTLCEYWRNVNVLKDLHQNCKTVAIDKDAINAQFGHCTTSLRKIKVDPKIKKVVQERCASFQSEALPDDHEVKKIFLQQKTLHLQQKALDEKINSYMKNVKAESNHSIIKNDNGSDSEDSSAFLNLMDADKGQLNQSNLSNTEELQENYKNNQESYKQNLAILSEKFGFPISTIYIDHEAHHGDLMTGEPTKARGGKNGSSSKSSINTNPMDFEIVEI